VCLLSINIAASANYSEKQIIEIGMGALVHDVGMLLIPKEIRFKKGKITEDEWFEIQKHPILGSYLLEKIKSLPKSVPFIAYQVHERENGRGYPKRRHGRLIHRFAKIVQVADFFEAMTSPRSYRKAFTPYEVISSLIKMVQQSLMPQDFTSAFLAYASLFPIGSLVQLNDHRIAKVVHTNSDRLSKPVVSILTDNDGKTLKKDKIYQEDLKDSSALQIIKALHSDYVKGIEIMDGF
jgi:HD-GYP domain-containing protein (c-di-GMP phosphodiesterase class II)